MGSANQIASSGIVQFLTSRTSYNGKYVCLSRFAVEEVSAAISRAAKELRYRQLKDKQYQAVSEFICSEDFFVSLPTCHGKSLYALLPAVYDVLRQHASSTSIVIVVSPLIALMKQLVIEASERP